MVQHRRKVSASLAIILSFAVVAMGLFRISEAGFSAQSGSAGGWETGSVVITDDDNGTALFSTGANGLLDGGQSLTRCIAVTYSGTMTSSIGVRLRAAASGPLASYLTTTIEEGTGGGAGTCAGFAPAKSLFTGTLAAFAAGHGTFATGVSTWAVAGTPETRTYRIGMTVQNVPAAQSKSATGTFTWEAGNPPPVPDLYEQAVLADNPLGYWRLGESSGTTMTDTSGNGHAGTYNAVTLGQAGALTGANTAMQSQNANSRGLVPGAAWMDTPTWSVEFWAKQAPIATSANYNFVTRVARPGQTVATDYIWSLQHTGDGKVAAVVFSSGNPYFYYTPVIMWDTNWHHIVTTWDGTTVKVYTDGTLATSGTPGPINRSPATDLLIANGRSTDDGGNPYYGSQYNGMDDVSFYGAPLSAAAVLAHYQAGKGL